MSLQIFFEDGKGNTINEDGREPVQMEVDEEAYPSDKINDFKMHSEMKPPERIMKPKVINKETHTLSEVVDGQARKRHQDHIKDLFFSCLPERFDCRKSCENSKCLPQNGI
jgi:hypothetical protein